RRWWRGRPTAETNNGLGYVIRRQGGTEEALAEFRRAIDINPKYPPACNNLAEALVRQGKLEEAESYYRRSLAEKPNPAVQNALDVVLRLLGKMDEVPREFVAAKASESVR